MTAERNVEDHNYGLDYLRIFAMAGVIWVHISVYVKVEEMFRKFFSWGGHGVQIFFVLSGYLAFMTYDKSQKPGAYYKKRITRILPSYYIGIILMILIHDIVSGGVYVDIYGLKWLRYFMGLNTLLPSNDYDIWNNLYGYWTMSCFIYFYIMVPLIAKWVRELKHAIVFYVICFGIFIIWKIGMTLIFSPIAGIDKLNSCIGASPFGMLNYFAIGIIACFAIRENRQNIALGVFLIIGISGLMIDKDAWTWAALSAIAIILFNAVDLKGKSERWNRCILKMSKQSMYIYLAHFMSFDICWYLINKMEGLLLFQRYVLWGIASVLCILLIVFMMNTADKTINTIVEKRKIHLNESCRRH